MKISMSSILWPLGTARQNLESEDSPAIRQARIRGSMGKQEELRLDLARLKIIHAIALIEKVEAKINEREHDALDVNGRETNPFKEEK